MYTPTSLLPNTHTNTSAVENKRTRTTTTHTTLHTHTKHGRIWCALEAGTCIAFENDFLSQRREYFVERE